MSDYEHTDDLEPYEVRAGRELLIHDTDGNVYAGEWSRSLVEDGDEDEFTLGYFDDPVRGENEPARIPIDALFRHVLYTGSTGYGKSTAIRNQLQQLVERGDGVAFFDAKGQDSKEFLKQIPEDRLDDVVWFNPGNPDADQTVGFNLLNTSLDPGDEGFASEAEELATEVVSFLRGSGTAWGATMDAVTKSVLHQLIAAEEEYTLLDMYVILSDEDEREAFVQKYAKGEMEEVYLKRLASEYSAEEFDPLLRRLREMAENRVVRNAFCSRGGLAFGDIVRDERILIIRTANIQSSEISARLATGLVKGLWAARKGQGYTNIEPFFLTIDEFDMYVTGDEMDLGDIISRGRALKFSVTLAHQQLDQLPEEVREAYANIDNLFTFNPGLGNVSGASKLAQMFGCGANRLQDLDQFEFVGRLINRQGEKTEPFNITQLASFPPVRSDDEVTDLITKSQQTYGVARTPNDFDFSEYGLQEE